MNLRIKTVDIRGAKRNCWYHCPLARALSREFPGNDFQVFTEYIRVNGTALDHSEDTKEFAEAWDAGEDRTRAQFVELPEGIHRYIKKMPALYFGAAWRTP